MSSQDPLSAFLKRLKDNLPAGGLSANVGNKRIDVRTALSALNTETIREYMAAGRQTEVLAAFGIPEYEDQYSEKELVRIRGILGVTDCAQALFGSFLMDVALPPPFRPPLMLMGALTGACIPGT